MLKAATFFGNLFKIVFDAEENATIQSTKTEIKKTFKAGSFPASICQHICKEKVADPEGIDYVCNKLINH